MYIYSNIYICVKMDDIPNKQISWVRCNICTGLGSENTQELFQFIIEQSKKFSLPVVLEDGLNFYNLILERNKKCQQTSKCDHEDMLKHVRFCIACHDNNVRTLICHYEIMEALINAQSNEKNQMLTQLSKTLTREKNAQ